MIVSVQDPISVNYNNRHEIYTRFLTRTAFIAFDGAYHGDCAGRYHGDGAGGYQGDGAYHGDGGAHHGEEQGQ